MESYEWRKKLDSSRVQLDSSRTQVGSNLIYGFEKMFFGMILSYLRLTRGSKLEPEKDRTTDKGRGRGRGG